MKFDDALIHNVMQAAPKGVTFEVSEVIEALRSVLDGRGYYYRECGTLVERVAYQEYRKLNPVTAAPTGVRGFFAR